MNITIPHSTLDNILTSLQPFLDKKDSSQITSHIYLETKDNTLLFKATDYEIGLITQTQNLTINKQGIATVNGKQILEIIKQLKDTDISLSIENNNLLIKQNKSSFKLPMFNAQEFPSLPDESDFSTLEIDALTFLSSMKKISPVIDTNNQRRELNGALLDIKENTHHFIATDTKRLGIIQCQNPSSQPLSLIFPKKAITEILKLFFDEITLLYHKEKGIILKSQNYCFFSQLINGTFPDYERIIPKELSYEFNLSKNKIIEGIRLIHSVTNDIQLTFKPDEIIVESLSNHENLEAKTHIEITLPIQEEIILGINSKHVLDFLNQIESAEFSWGINGKNAPFMLRSENFSTIIMPIIL